MSEAGKRGLRNEIGLMMLILLSTSCGLITGVKKSGLERRGVGATGEVVLADGTSTARGTASIGEARDPGRPETEVATVQVYAQSYFLYGHMTRAELRDAQTPSRLLGSYPPKPTSHGHQTYSSSTVLTIGQCLLRMVAPWFWPANSFWRFRLTSRASLWSVSR